ncbi:hypothetical protein F2Q68_00025919 [Brassica cretica]|uniref:Pectinesterase n=1 Tax=Brassica cretica TaxID=69181 RepID=A0A8S9IJM8_BRACR|nr:hypothetical protein F2Q68_00025919 [Brassica cretica]
MLATKDAITKSSNFTATTEEGLGKNMNETSKAVLEYCKRVLTYALEDLETIVEEMGEDLQQSGSKIDQLKQWLTGVFNYQTDCLDDIEEEELRKIMGEGISNSKVLTSNAIDIFHSVVTAMSQMGVKVDDMGGIGAPGRRLLEDIDAKGLPTWLSGKDRKLMAQVGRGGDDGIGEGGGGGGKIKATHVVAKDGSGNFKTISEAVNACPEKNPGRCIIHIKAGVYKEMVRIPKKKNNIFMFGDGATKTIITFDKSVALSKTTTSLSATVQTKTQDFVNPVPVEITPESPRRNRPSDPSISADPISVHHRMGLMSNLSEPTRRGVFWDMEDCPISEGLDPAIVFDDIKATLRKTSISW